MLQLCVAHHKDEDEKVKRIEKVVGYHAIHFYVDLLSEESKEGVFFVSFFFSKFVSLSPLNSF